MSLFLNAPFEIEFNGKTYSIRAANVVDAIAYQKKLQELSDNKSPAIDLELAIYCLYLVLHRSDETVTEDYVKDNCPADVDTIGLIEKLGFMSPQKRAQMLMRNQIKS